MVENEVNTEDRRFLIKGGLSAIKKLANVQRDTGGFTHSTPIKVVNRSALFIAMDCGDVLKLELTSV